MTTFVAAIAGPIKTSKYQSLEPAFVERHLYGKYASRTQLRRDSRAERISSPIFLIIIYIQKMGSLFTPNIFQNLTKWGIEGEQFSTLRHEVSDRQSTNCKDTTITAWR